MTHFLATDCDVRFNSAVGSQYVKTIDICNGFSKNISILSNCESPSLLWAQYWWDLGKWRKLYTNHNFELQGIQLQVSAENTNMYLYLWVTYEYYPCRLGSLDINNRFSVRLPITTTEMLGKFSND